MKFSKYSEMIFFKRNKILENFDLLDFVDDSQYTTAIFKMQQSCSLILLGKIISNLLTICTCISVEIFMSRNCFYLRYSSSLLSINSNFSSCRKPFIYQIEVSFNASKTLNQNQIFEYAKCPFAAFPPIFLAVLKKTFFWNIEKICF